MRSRAIAVAAFALLTAAFVVDVVTPQTLVIAILLDVPIVLAALTQSRRLTASLVVAALAADVAAAVLDAAQADYRWDPIGVGDRLLSMLSIVLVGYLSTAVQERAERVGRLAAQEARARREAALAAAADRMRASLSPELVARAVVREAPDALGAEAAYWYPAGRDDLLAARAGRADVEVVSERPPPEIASLVHRAAEAGDVAIVRDADPVSRFVLERYLATGALVLPLADRGAHFGVLVATSKDAAFEDGAAQPARAFAAIAVNALAQARLFGELAQRNDALAERQAVIRDLVYALSHDLRTPLAALGTTMRQAVDGAYGALPDRYEAVLRESVVSVDDLMRLADTLLLVARFESGERPAVGGTVDAAALARESVAELGALAASRGIALAAEGPPQADARGARADLKRALANLIANALQHTPRGGRVVVRVACGAGDRVTVAVEDDGYGIDERLRGRLFERFASASRAGGGTGLGLYIVRRIAEESGGSVSYAPRTPRGSVFTLALPPARA